jgi:hypothetical protein
MLKKRTTTVGKEDLLTPETMWWIDLMRTVSSVWWTKIDVGDDDDDDDDESDDDDDDEVLDSSTLTSLQFQVINCNSKVILMVADSPKTKYYIGYRKRFHFSAVQRHTQCS